MLKIGNKSTVLAAMFAAVVLVPGAVMAQSGCSYYVTESLKQQSENTVKKCGFTGMGWSASKSTHENHCAKTPPPVWKKELLARKANLAACKPK